MTKGRMKLYLDHHFWGVLALRLKLAVDTTCKTAWVDGVTLGYNPEFISSLSFPEIVTTVAHETVHVALMHHLRRKGRNFRLWNEACDHAANLILKENGFQVPRNFLCDEAYRGMSAEQIYAILDQKQKQEQQQQLEQQANGQGDKSDSQESSSTSDQGTDDQDQDDEQPGDEDVDDSTGDQNDDQDGEASDDDEQGDVKPGDESAEGNEEEGDQQENQRPGNQPGEPADQDNEDGDEDDGGGGYGEVRDQPGADGESLSPQEIEAAEQEVRIILLQAAQHARSRGLLPAGIERLVGALVEPEVDWRTALREFVEVVAMNDYSWERADQGYLNRGLYVPSLGNLEIGNLVLVMDTSGSVVDEQVQAFFSEFSEVLETYSDVTVTLLFCDTQVYFGGEFRKEDLPIDAKAQGGGGTAFAPAFRWVEENMDTPPTCLIYMTDLEGSFPREEPDYPVLWLYDGYYKTPPAVPFGTVIKKAA